MTNDEIEQRAVECFDTHSDPHKNANLYMPADIQERVTQAIREVVAQAYDEAATIAENYGEEEWDYPQQIGGDIRALKDSLNA